jgi:hypothetical protein
MRRVAGLTSRRRLLLGGAVLVGIAIIIIAALLIFRSDLAAEEEQPIAFSHKAHAQSGIQCQFCHSGVNKSPVAGIPSVELCMGCHEHVATDQEPIQELTGYWERGEAIPWNRVNKQPDYVFFNHSSHISSGVSCGSCHGDVANMTVAEPVVHMNMGFCLGCHAEQENKDALYDCVVCHR